MEESLFNLRNCTDQSKGNAAYEALPESIKAIYSESEWLWQRDKHLLIQQETEPETE
jgi:hypothetical protein